VRLARACLVDPLVLVAVGLAAGAALALAPAPTALGVVAVAALLRARLAGVGLGAGARPVERRTSRLALGLALSGVLLSGLRARAALERAGRSHADAAEHLSPPARCAGRAVVAGSPVVLQGAVPANPAARARIVVELREMSCSGRALPAGLRARILGAPEDLARGDELELVADLAPIELYWNSGLTDPRTGIALHEVTASGAALELRRLSRGAGLLGWIDRARAAVRRRIEASYSPELAPFARALVLGETDLDDADQRAFRRSGLAHLLAVSGTHLVLAVLAVVRALETVLARLERLAARHDVGALAAALGAPLCWIYADFAGGGGSAYRAAAMLSAALAVRALGRRPSSLRCFAASLLGGAALEPLAICDMSFALSLGATAGLLAARGAIARALRGRHAAIRALLGAALGTTSAMLGCAPVQLLFSPELALLGVAANVLAVPIGEIVALPLCLVHAGLWWAPGAERGAALVASGALALVRAVAHAAGDGMLSVLRIGTPTAEQLAALGVGLLAVALCRERGRRLALTAVLGATLLLLERGAVHAGAPRGVLRLSMLDVGQGDALLVDLPDGRLMLIDGGGSTSTSSRFNLGRRVLLPVLRARRRQRIDVAVVTHPHPDHYGGLLTTLHELEVGELWLGPGSDGPDAPAALAALRADLAHRGVVLRTPATLCGRPWRFGAARIDVLAPCTGGRVAPRTNDQAVNDQSLVLRVAFGERALLLTGDAGAAAERQLQAESPAELAVDVLKVGHHGSRFSSSPGFLAAVAPRVALVSCGIRNRFGHPDPGTLGHLAALGALGLRSDRGGEIDWQTDGRGFVLERPDGWRARWRPSGPGP
jgi:competence protein ComEC